VNRVGDRTIAGAPVHVDEYVALRGALATDQDSVNESLDMDVLDRVVVGIQKYGSGWLGML